MRPEVHVIVVWPGALVELERILADAARRFRLLRVVRLGWSPSCFDRNVLRFYGKPVLGDDEKLALAGMPVVAVVEDASPVHGVRPRSSGPAVVNVRTFDAKKRYRSWVGGTHAVHASIDVPEAARDLFYLLGARLEDMRGSDTWSGTIAHRDGELIGHDGWSDDDELLTAVALAMPLTVLEDGDELHVLVESVCWAVLFADVRSVERRADGLACEVLVAGARRTLVLQEPGDGVLDAAWQRRLLPPAGQLPDEHFAAGPRDRQLARAHRLVVHAPHLVRDVRTERAFVEDELRRNGITVASGGSTAVYEPAFLHGGTLPPLERRPRRGASARARLRALVRRR